MNNIVNKMISNCTWEVCDNAVIIQLQEETFVDTCDNFLHTQSYFVVYDLLACFYEYCESNGSYDNFCLNFDECMQDEEYLKAWQQNVKSYNFVNNYLNKYHTNYPKKQFLEYLAIFLFEQLYPLNSDFFEKKLIIHFINKKNNER